MEPETLFGREPELAAVRELLGRAAAGSCSLVVEGQAGIGKTSLLEAAIASARERGYVVCRARGVEGEGRLSLAGLGDLLDGLADSVLPALPPPQRRALAVALLLEDADEPSPPRALSVAFLATMRELAAVAPLAVAVDDAQWVDPTTLGLLAFAARRLRTEPVVFMLTRRPGSPHAALSELERALPSPAWLEPGPLTLGALGALLRLRLGSALTRPALRAVREASGGNPFFALELARAIEERGLRISPSGELPVPPTLRVLVRERLASVGQSLREALLVAALARQPTAALVRAATGADPDLAAAEAAGVITVSEGEIRFSHPLLAASLVEDAGGERLRSVHRRLAALVEDPEGRARHLAAAAAAPDETVAAALDDAASLAARRGAQPAAAELAGLALAVTDPSDSLRSARRARVAGRLYAVVGDAARGGELMHLAIRGLPPGPERAGAIFDLLDSATAIDDPVGLAREAFAEAGGDATLCSYLHSAVSEVHLVRGEFEHALRHAEEARALADAGSDPLLRVLTLGRAANLETLLGCGDPEGGFALAIRLEQGLSDERTHAVSSPRNHYARRLFWRDDLDGARPLFEELRRDAIETFADDCRPNVCLYLARVELRAGQLTLARRYAEEAFGLAESAGYPQVLGGTLSVRALVTACEGDVEGARALVAESEPYLELVSDHWHELHNRVTLGLAAVSTGSFDEAANVLDGLDAELDALGIAEPGVFPFEGDAIEAYAALGRAGDADRLVERLRRRPRPRTLAVAARGEGLVAAGAGRLDEAVACFEEALRWHDELADPVERGRTLLALGSVLRRARRHKEARERLEEARSLLEAAGAEAFAGTAQAELERIGGRRSAGGLTPTEARVAAHAAEGLSNREIAATLVVTVKAVEAHLTRSYAKLGVRSRAELVRLMTLGP